MTSVAGHLTGLELDPGYQDWKYPPPVRMFDAPVHIKVADEVNTITPFGL